MILKVLVKTLAGTAPEALATGDVKSVRLGAKIMCDSGDTVHIGGADVSSTTGWLLTSTPIEIGSIEDEAGGALDLTKIFVQGAEGDIVRVLYVKDDVMV